MSEIHDASLYGSLYARDAEHAGSQAAQLRQLKQQLAELKRKSALHRAIGSAAREIAAEIIRETAQADAGDTKVRHLSAPTARELRNAELAQRTQRHARGLHLKTEEIAQLAAKKRLI